MDNGINPTVIIFSKYKDTDELIESEGRDAFLNAYNSRVNFIDFELNYLKNNKDLTKSVDASTYINESIKVINGIDDDILRELKIKELSDEFGVSTDIIKSKITNKNVKVVKEIKKVPKKIRYNKYDTSEIRILYLMLNNEEVISYYENHLGYLNNPERKKLANAIINYKNNNKTLTIRTLYVTLVCVKTLVKS